MADTIIAALVAGMVALTVAYLTQFLSERYRRFLDGSAMAAGIVGELSSYEGAAQKLEAMIRSWIAAAKAGRLSELKFRPFDKPTDMFFDVSVAKVGVLGAPLVGHVVYIYANLRAFRLALDLITKHHADMGKEEFLARCEAALERLDRAENRGIFAMPYLKKRAGLKFHERLGSVPIP